MTVNAATVGIVILVIVCGYFGLVMLVEYQAEQKRRADVRAAAAEEAQRRATDAVRVQGQTDAALDAELSAALKRPPPGGIVR